MGLPSPGTGWQDGAGGMLPVAPGVALTRSRGSRDSGARPRVAAVALGTRRRHRQRQRDETSRMPTSGATRRTELGRSSKSSLGEEGGAGGFRGDPLNGDHVTGPPAWRNPYLVTPTCQARTSQLLPAGNHKGVEIGTSLPWGDHPTSGAMLPHSTQARRGCHGGPSSPLAPSRVGSCSLTPAWGLPCKHKVAGAGGRRGHPPAPTGTHSWAPAAGPGRAACRGISGKRSGRGGRGCWFPGEL